MLKILIEHIVVPPILEVECLQLLHPRSQGLALRLLLRLALLSQILGELGQDHVLSLDVLAHSVGGFLYAVLLGHCAVGVHVYAHLAIYYQLTICA